MRGRAAWTAGALAAALGKGLVSGAAGTAAMTLAQNLEMKASGRSGSRTPAHAVGKVAGVEPEGEQAQARLSQITHWAYGTAWGAARVPIDALGVRGPAAPLLHLALVWGAGLTMLPALRLAPPPTQWDRSTLAMDLGFHLVYVLGAHAAYEALARRGPGLRAR